jgi:hypothetical protein
MRARTAVGTELGRRWGRPLRAPLVKSTELPASASPVGIFPNDEAIIRLVGAILLEQNDVYGLSPICKDDHVATETGLAVVDPALSRGNVAAGPDGIRGSATGQMDELVTARIISLASAEPGLTGSPSRCVALASRRQCPDRRRAPYAACAAILRYPSSRVIIAQSARAVL